MTEEAAPASTALCAKRSSALQRVPRAAKPQRWTPGSVWCRLRDLITTSTTPSWPSGKASKTAEGGRAEARLRRKVSTFSAHKPELLAKAWEMHEAKCRRSSCSTRNLDVLQRKVVYNKASAAACVSSSPIWALLANISSNFRITASNQVPSLKTG